MAKILILGGGFAAIAAVEILTKSLGDQDEIVLVSKNDKFIFHPGLVPLVFGKLKLNEIYFDLPRLLQPRRIRFVRGEVIAIDPNQRKVRLVNGPDEELLNYDFLLIAFGRKIKITAIPGFYEYSNNILDVESALLLKRGIAEFDAGSIVVGLCPGASLPVPVLEAALGCSEKFRQKIKKNEVSIKILLPGTLEQALSGSGLFRDVEAEFEKKKIDVVSEFPIAGIDMSAIFASDGRRINYDLPMLMPAFLGQAVGENPSPFADSEGFVHVDETMQVVGFDHIFAAGDVISLPGPRFGYMAIRQGKVAAKNIVAELRGETSRAEYKHELEWVLGERYTDPVFFHYGFWDDTLEDFDEKAFFGMAKVIRKRYGKVKNSGSDELLAATSM